MPQDIATSVEISFAAIENHKRFNIFRVKARRHVSSLLGASSNRRYAFLPQAKIQNVPREGAAMRS